MEINKCPISNTDKSIKYLDLGNIPLVNNLSDTKEDSLSCKRFPLVIQLFEDSNLSCLTHVVKLISFVDYLYSTNINKPYLEHASKMYHYLMDYVNIQDNDLVVDIGGNDGSLLKEFKVLNDKLRFINIDPAENFIEINTNSNIEYVNLCFDENVLLDQKAKIIVSTNVFQHTHTIISFVKSIQKNLTDDGVWCLEFPYFFTTLLDNNYDQIYHEHIYYYFLKNIVDLVEQEDMKVINVSYRDIHAGTLRVISAKKVSKLKRDSTINSFLDLEKLITPQYCENWGKSTLKKIKLFKKYISDLSKNNVIVGFGAAAKGCIFLNTCGLDYTNIDFVIDDTVGKQHKFIPGTGIEIVSREILKEKEIDYIIILAHNFKDYIIESLRNQYNGKFIIMFPDIRIIE